MQNPLEDVRWLARQATALLAQPRGDSDVLADLLGQLRHAGREARRSGATPAELSQAARSAQEAGHQVRVQQRLDLFRAVTRVHHSKPEEREHARERLLGHVQLALLLGMTPEEVLAGTGSLLTDQDLADALDQEP